MTIASALDALNDKLAGSDQQASQTIEGMIYRIIENIDAGGGSIPIASADTLGGIKVGENLSITEGGVLSASGGGGGGLVCNATYDAETEVYTLNKTAGEIVEAIGAGNSVWIITPQEGYDETSFVNRYVLAGQYYFFYDYSNEYGAASLDDYPYTNFNPGGGDEPGLG